MSTRIDSGGPLATATPRIGEAGVWIALALALATVAVVSLGLGRYGVPVDNVIGILLSHVVPMERDWSDAEVIVVELVRVPRIIVAALVGAGLALSGAALQGVFRNPLIGPQIIGVSSGAAFGGALALLLAGSMAAIVAGAFAFALVSLAVVLAVSRVDGRSSLLTLVLGGVVASTLFAALVSLLVYVADPETRLPGIVFWLMGSFASADYAKCLVVSVAVGLGGLVMVVLRWRINVLSLGDEDAESLGIKVERTRWLILVAVCLVVAGQVAVSGVVGWVGLVIPHFARMLVGPDHRRLLPASALIGAIYLLAIDDLARVLTPQEIPLGILTAIVGAPVFAVLLRRMHGRGWGHA